MKKRIMNTVSLELQDDIEDCSINCTNFELSGNCINTIIDAVHCAINATNVENCSFNATNLDIQADNISNLAIESTNVTIIGKSHGIYNIDAINIDFSKVEESNLIVNSFVNLTIKDYKNSKLAINDNWNGDKFVQITTNEESITIKTKTKDIIIDMLNKKATNLPKNYQAKFKKHTVIIKSIKKTSFQFNGNGLVITNSTLGNNAQIGNTYIKKSKIKNVKINIHNGVGNIVNSYIEDSVIG